MKKTPSKKVSWSERHRMDPIDPSRVKVLAPRTRKVWRNEQNRLQSGLELAVSVLERNKNKTALMYSAINTLQETINVLKENHKVLTGAYDNLSSDAEETAGAPK